MLVFGSCPRRRKTRTPLHWQNSLLKSAGRGCQKQSGLGWPGRPGKARWAGLTKTGSGNDKRSLRGRLSISRPERWQSGRMRRFANSPHASFRIRHYTKVFATIVYLSRPDIFPAFWKAFRQGFGPGQSARTTSAGRGHSEQSP